MPELLMVSIGLGLAVSLLFGELFGLAAGGMIVPGYFALYLNQPILIAGTLAAALVTHFILRGLSQVTIVYGRRLTALTILVGYLVGMAFRFFLDGDFMSGMNSTEGAIIGFIIPGLIAIWFQRQGITETVISLLTASIIVRLILVAAFGQLVSL